MMCKLNELNKRKGNQNEGWETERCKSETSVVNHTVHTSLLAFQKKNYDFYDHIQIMSLQSGDF